MPSRTHASRSRTLARRVVPHSLRRRLLDIVGAARGEAPPQPSQQQQPQPPPPPRRVASPKPESPPLLEGLLKGRSITSAALSQLRAYHDGNDDASALSLAGSLREHAETRETGHLALAASAQLRGYGALAWHEFSQVSTPLWATWAPEEFVRAGLAVDPPAVRAAVEGLLQAAPDGVGAKQWWSILKPLFGAGEEELSRRVFHEFESCMTSGRGMWAGAEAARDWMSAWIDLPSNSPSTPPVPEPRIPFAAMDYGTPDRYRASRNIGDPVQTLASLGHVVRHQNLRFHGPTDLVDLVRDLQSRVRPEIVLDEVTADVELLTVHRDASTYNQLPPGTWMLAFGWFMHPVYSERHIFPFHDNIRPIFVSFHCNKRNLLTAEAVAYLKRYGPVGCRDWTTVDVLLSLGVPAFFSGCLTTTVSTVFPDLTDPPGPQAPIGYSDVPASSVPDGCEIFRHSRDQIRFTPFTQNIRDAIAMLEHFRRDFSAMVTSRLHCYLPTRSLGMKVEFRPKNRSDVRFPGLIDITDEEFERMRVGILDKLQHVLTCVFAGAGEDEVYETWRRVTVQAVTEAEQRRARHATPPRIDPEILRRADQAVSATTTQTGQGSGESLTGQRAHVAVIVPRRRRKPTLQVLLSTLHEHANGPLTVHLISAEGLETEFDSLRSSFPDLSLRLIPVAGLEGCLDMPPGSRVGPEDIAQVLLSRLLPGVSRVVILPVDAVVEGDVSELAGLELNGNLIAAPGTGQTSPSGFGVLHGAAQRLRNQTSASTELRRRAYARHRFDFDAFSTHVLVLDLQGLRSHAFVDNALGSIQEFGLTFREILHMLFGAERAELPLRWATSPTRVPVDMPALVSWSDGVMPWRAPFAPEQDRWLRVSARLNTERSNA